MSKKSPTTVQVNKEVNIRVNKEVNKDVNMEVNKGLLVAVKVRRVSYHFPLASLSMDFLFRTSSVSKMASSYILCNSYSNIYIFIFMFSSISNDSSALYVFTYVFVSDKA